MTNDAMLRKILCPFLFLISFYGHSQNTIALPEIINYSKRTYNAGTQNWKIGQDKQGIIYVANNECLLSFDGNYWKKRQIGFQETLVRTASVEGRP